MARVRPGAGPAQPAPGRPEAAPGADLLAFDEQAGRAVVLHVTGETVEWQVSRALAAAAEVASWDAAKLASVSEALEAVVPGDSPALVLVAGGFDPRALATVEWLAKRHGVEVSCFSVSVLRFGNERLLSVRARAARRRSRPIRPRRCSGCSPAPSAPSEARRRPQATASTPPPGN